MYSSETNQFERTEHIYIRFDWYRDEINLAQSSRGIDCVRKLHPYSLAHSSLKRSKKQGENLLDAVNNFEEREGKKRNFAPFAATGFGPSSPNAAKGLADMIRCPFKN